MPGDKPIVVMSIDKPIAVIPDGEFKTSAEQDYYEKKLWSFLPLHVWTNVASFLTVDQILSARCLSRSIYTSLTAYLTDIVLPAEREKSIFHASSPILSQLAWQDVCSTPLLFTTAAADMDSVALARRKRASRLFGERIVVFNDVDNAKQLVAWMYTSPFSIQHAVISADCFSLHFLSTQQESVEELLDWTCPASKRFWTRALSKLVTLHCKLCMSESSNSLLFFKSLFSEISFTRLSTLCLEGFDDVVCDDCLNAFTIRTWKGETGRLLKTVSLDCRLLENSADAFFCFFEWACNLTRLHLIFDDETEDLLFCGNGRLPSSWDASILRLSIDSRHTLLHDYQIPTPNHTAFFQELKHQRIVLEHLSLTNTRFSTRNFWDALPLSKTVSVISVFADSLPPLFSILNPFWESISHLKLRVRINKSVDLKQAYDALTLLPNLERLDVEDACQRRDRRVIPHLGGWQQVAEGVYQAILSEDVDDLPLGNKTSKHGFFPCRPPRLRRLAFVNVHPEHYDCMKTMVQHLEAAPWDTETQPRPYCLVTVSYRVDANAETSQEDTRENVSFVL